MGFDRRRILIPTVGLRFSSIAVCALLALATPPTLVAAHKNHASSSSGQPSQLQHHYDAAQRFQQSGDTQRASAEYRAFIAEAVGQLATGYAGAGDYTESKVLFDESLEANPAQPALREVYAEAALAHGDYAQAKALAEQMLRDEMASGSASKKTLAKAHLILGRALLKLRQDKDSKKELESAVDLDPNFEDGYALAVACLDMDDGKCADRIFTEMEASFGDTAPLHMEFGRAYSQSDFPQKAVAELKKAIAENPRMPQAHYLLAASYLASAEAGSLVKAKAELKKELEVSPKDFLTYAALGHIAVTQHQYDDAAAYLKKAIALNPDNPDAYLYSGQMNYEMHRTAEAEAALREAIAKTKDVSRNRYQIQKAYYLLGRLLIRSGQRAEGQKEMNVAQKLMTQTLAQDKSRFGGNNPGANGMGSGGIRSDEITVQEHADKPMDSKAMKGVQDFAERLGPPLADSYNNLGAIAASGKNFADALGYFQRAAEWNPELPGLDYNWGRAAFMASRFKDAVPPLRRYLQAHPEDAGIRSPLAISEFMVGDYTDVVKTLEPVLSGIDAIPQVEYVYAASLAKTGQRAAGVERLRAMEKKNPSIPDVHRSLGEAYADGNSSDREKAQKEFAAAIRLNPKDAVAHYDLGTFLLKIGNLQAAIPELETAVRLEPDNRAAHALLGSAYRRAGRPDDAARERGLTGSEQ
ncbi:MAG: tetratricopeptide repeat protein [Acidobacteriaceae bacterium]